MSDKIYIGQTVRTIKQRLQEHICDAQRGSNYAIHNAIRKYGGKHFKTEEICRCKSKELIDRCEIFCIKYFKSKAPCGYNLADGGEGFLPGNISWNKTPDDSIPPLMKTCIKCSHEKLLKEFTKDKTCAFGRSGICKRCTADYANKRYEAGLVYQKKGRFELTKEQKKINRKKTTKKYRENMPTDVKHRSCKHSRENQNRWAKELNDNYIKKVLYMRLGLRASECDNNLIALTRSEIELYRSNKNGVK